MSRGGGALLAAVALLGACGDEGGEEGAADGGTVTVLAAASLTDAFEELAADFEETNEGVSVDLAFGSSSGLATSVTEGAPADVFASASPTAMDVVVEADAAEGEPREFAANRLEVAVPAGNPSGVRGLEDLARGDLLVGLCAEEVPCGQFGRELLDRAGVTPAVDTEEADVRALLAKVSSGELDVGIVYETDVRAAGDAVEGITSEGSDEVVARYPIVPLADAPEPDLADAFTELVLSEDGQEVLGRYGFLAP